MTRDEIKQVITTKNDEWLESRWSILNDAIKKIEPELTEIEAAFDHDYTVNSQDDPLEQHVTDQVLAICSMVTLSDTEMTVSWTEIQDMINKEIERREDWRSDENQKQIMGLAKPAAVKRIRLEPPVCRPQKGHGQG